MESIFLSIALMLRPLPDAGGAGRHSMLGRDGPGPARHSMLGRDRPPAPPRLAVPEAEWEEGIRRDIEAILEAGGDPFY